MKNEKKIGRGFGNLSYSKGRKHKKRIKVNISRPAMMQTKPEFSSSDYFVGSESHGTVWINPNESDEARKAFEKLSVADKKLRTLIAECYPDLNIAEKTHKVYQWNVEWLYVLNSMEQRKFLFKDPNLAAWENVFKRGTEKENILFNLYFMDVYGYVLDPNLWAGRSLKSTLFLYYLFLTKKYVVFVSSERVYYQYVGKKWQIRQPQEIIEDLSGWLSRVSVKGVDKLINSSSDQELLNKFKMALTIKRWPFVMGHNFNNGFLTLQDNRYVLFPHNAAFWARHLILIDIPSEIIPVFPPRMLRLVLDNVSEELINATLFKLILCFVIEEGSHNLIINFSGNPRGAKTLLMDYISDILGDEYKVGRFKAMDGFIREELVINARVISFPDANPKKIEDDAIDFLKSASGRDKILLNHKFGKIYHGKTSALIIITNNEDYDAVAAYKEEAFADRVMNYVAPSIRSNATVADLKDKLEPEGVAALFLFGLTIDPEILSKAQRAGEFNAVTGSGEEKIYIQFLLNHCVYCQGHKTVGQDVYKAYKIFLQGVDKKMKADSLKVFFKKLEYYLDKVTPRGIERSKSNKGVTYKNMLIGTPGKVKQNVQAFTYQGTQQMKDLLNKNSFKCDHIIFKNDKGTYTKGPRLNPAINKQIYETLSAVKNTNLKEMIEGNCPLDNNKHFETTGFGSAGADIHSLKKSDFEEKLPVSYQSKLQYGVRTNEKITDLGNFENPEFAEYFKGELHPMTLMPDANPYTSQKIDGASQDFQWLGEFNLNSDLFLSKPKTDINYLLQKEANERIKKALIGPVDKVELETYAPRKDEEQIEQKTQIRGPKSKEKQGKRGRPSKSNKSPVNDKNSLKTSTQENTKLNEINEYFKSKV